MKTWIKLALIFGAIGIFVVWLIVDAQQQEARMTAKGTALVTEVTLKEDPESSSLDETEFDLQLAAQGGEVNAKATLPGDRSADFQPGHRFTVCYNPSAPSEIDIELDDAVTCGS